MSRAKPLTADDKRHGTTNAYVNFGCRCESCREANTRACLERNHRKGRSVPRTKHLAERRLIAIYRENHGTETRYHFGCRCADCREAERVGRARRRARTAAS